MKPKPTLRIYTIGHSTRPIAEFIKILEIYQIQQVVDIRTIPRSRHNPQYNRETLPNSLAESKIEYMHIAGLGGLRHPHPDSINLGWRNASFRGYADYMQTPEFGEHIKQLIQLAQEQPIVIMCAEAVPWRCHRSLVADALTLWNIEVIHILNEKKNYPHKLTPFAKIDGKHITYPG
jgi:uncharacterized protein (DUF488 family)